MIYSSPTYLDSEAATIINFAYYEKYNNHISKVIYQVINNAKCNLDNQLIEKIAAYSQHNEILRISNLLGIRDYLYITGFYGKEMISKVGGTYKWYLECELSNNQLIRYISYVMEPVLKDKAIFSSYRIKMYKNTCTSKNKNKIIIYFSPTNINRIDTPLYWLHRFHLVENRSCILPIGFFRDTWKDKTNQKKPICLYASELLSNPKLNVNLSILELFQESGYHLDKQEANLIWNRWKNYLLWKRKSYLVISLTLVAKNRATIVKEYDWEDETYYYTEIGELLLAISNIELYLQQLISSYL